MVAIPLALIYRLTDCNENVGNDVNDMPPKVIQNIRGHVMLYVVLL